MVHIFWQNFWDGHNTELTFRYAKQFPTSVHLKLANLESILTSERINSLGEQSAQNMTASDMQSVHDQGLTRSELEAQTLNLEPRVWTTWGLECLNIVSSIRTQSLHCPTLLEAFSLSPEIKSGPCGINLRLSQIWRAYHENRSVRLTYDYRDPTCTGRTGRVFIKRYFGRNCIIVTTLNNLLSSSLLWT